MTERICDQSVKTRRNESNIKRTAIVVAITMTTMIAEIVYGLITGSMALLADGIHMGTHTFALVVTVIAYIIAGRHADNPDFAFSSGKVGVLGGYSNAIILGITALYMIYEAVHRLINPETIIFNQALLVDYHPAAEDNEKLQKISSDSDAVIQDLHIWHTSENHKAVILKVRAGASFDREAFAGRVRTLCKYDHLTLDVVM